MFNVATLISTFICISSLQAMLAWKNIEAINNFAQVIISMAIVDNEWICRPQLLFSSKRRSTPSSISYGFVLLDIVIERLSLIRTDT